MRIFAFLIALVISCAYVLANPQQITHENVGAQLGELYGGNGTATRHTNNWAVLVCASRYWFNYRHMANTLAMYRTIKRLGIPDSNIILMLADDAACNPRNSFPAAVYASSGRKLDLYGEGIEVDYRGYEVTVESFLRLLTGRHESYVPASKRLLTDASSNVFIYMTGHGGNEFLKFQDNEEVSAFDIADAVEQMWEKRRYNRLLYVIDTCQANSMYSKFYSPNIISTGSSMVGENSYSHHNDHDIGVAIIDAYTHFILAYLETIIKTSKATLQDFFNTYDPGLIKSHPGVSTELSPISPQDTLVTDFFGGVASVEVQDSAAKLPLRHAPAPWRQVSSKTIGGSATVGPRTFKPRSPRDVRGDVGWLRPLERGTRVVPQVIGGLAITVIAGVLSSRVAAGSSERK